MSGLKGNQKKGNDGKFVPNPVLKPTRSLTSMTPTGNIARVDGNWYEVETLCQQHEVDSPTVNRCRKCGNSVDGRYVWAEQEHSPEEELEGVEKCSHCDRLIDEDNRNHSTDCYYHPDRAPRITDEEEREVREIAAHRFADLLQGGDGGLTNREMHKVELAASALAAHFVQPWHVVPPKGYDALDNDEIVEAMQRWDIVAAWDAASLALATQRKEQTTERNELFVSELGEILDHKTDPASVAGVVKFFMDSYGDNSTSEEFGFLESSPSRGVLGGQYRLTDAAATLDACEQKDLSIRISSPIQFDAITSALPNGGDLGDGIPLRVEFDYGVKEQILNLGDAGGPVRSEMVRALIAQIEA